MIVAAAKWLWGGLAALAGVALASRASGASAPFGGGSAFRNALMAVALADVDRVRESGGKNRGPEVDRALADLGLGPGQNWCAAYLWVWVRKAAAMAGIAPPFQGTGGAKVTGERAAAAGRKVLARDMSPETVPPGSIIVWDRSPGEPFSSWEGHIGVLVQWTGSASFHTVEANSGQLGDRVADMARTTGDPRLMFAAVL